jgi:hypothetical protein
MSLEARLVRCKQYREEALKHPRANKLYIEDLDLSIAMFENAVKNNMIIGKGWIENEEA